MKPTLSFIKIVSSVAAFFCLLAITSDCSAAVLEGTTQILRKDGSIKEDGSNAVVFIDAIGNQVFSLPPQNPVILQKGKKFVPEVLPVVVGTTVDFLNDDDIFHNVFSLSEIKPFDLGLYKQRLSKQVLYDKTGLSKIYCNIHPNMAGYVLVLSNPYFAVTAEDGSFRIEGISPGTYRVRVWQRFGPEVSRDIVIGEGVNTAKFVLGEDKTTQTHKNKLGKDYSRSYP